MWPIAAPVAATCFFPMTTGRDFSTCWERLAERFGVEIHAYSLAGNQYHLLVHTPNGGLGRGMRHLDGVYTQRFNRRHHSDGPLFRGRYKAVVVDPDQKLAPVSRFIHAIPLDLGAAGSLKSYAWSSFPAYVRAAAAPAWLRTKTVLSCFGRKKRRKQYRAYMKDGVDEEIRAFYGAKRTPPVLGGADFRERSASGCGFSRATAGMRRCSGFAIGRRSSGSSEATADVFGVGADAIHASRRGRGSRNIPRLVAMSLCRSPGGHSLADIASAFGIGHYASVSVAANRLKTLVAADAALANDVERVRERLDACEKKRRRKRRK